VEYAVIDLLQDVAIITLGIAIFIHGVAHLRGRA